MDTMGDGLLEERLSTRMEGGWGRREVGDSFIEETLEMSIRRLRVLGEKVAGRRNRRRGERINGIIFPACQSALAQLSRFYHLSTKT